MRLSDCTGSRLSAQREQAGLRVRVARVELQHAQIARSAPLEVLGARVDAASPSSASRLRGFARSARW